MSEQYVTRLADEAIPRLMRALPALLIVGPRATGKTTTARRYANSIVQLDNPPEAAAFVADPDAALKRFEEPVLLDEWQEVPGVLGAIKRSVDHDPHGGRFLLTGSVRADLDAETWPGTGRVVRMPMYGLTMRELSGRSEGPTFVNALASADLGRLAPPPSPPDLPGYVEIALRGGFPFAMLQLDETERRDWLHGYVEQLVTRDASHISARDPARLGRYLEALALNSAGTATEKTIYDAAGIDRKTAVAYERLLVNMLVLELIPAWYTNRLSRLIKSPKRYLIDPSLIGAALRVDVRAVMRDGNLIGRLLDTLVVAQLRPEVALDSARPRLFHFREKDGRREIDLVVEGGAERVVAIEVKVTASPSRDDARHLRWLKERLGERFLAGAVLHTGPSAFSLGENLLALPIASIWGSR